MLRLFVAAVCLAIAALAVMFGYPYQYHGAFFVMHDHQVSLSIARCLRVVIPLAALIAAVLAIWNIKQLLRWTRGES
jgi:hypothetical protein